MRVFLLRHAPSNKNIQGRQGAAQPIHDWRLTEQGEAEAALVATRLKAFGRFDGVYSSPDTAAVQTAELMARVHGLGVDQMPKLKSIDLGVVSGMSDAEVAAEHPFVARQLNLYHCGFLHPRDYVIPAAEKNSEFEARVRDALRTIAAARGDQVCVVAHRSTITMAVNAIANGSSRSDEGYYELIDLAPLSVTVIDLTTGAALGGRILAVGRPVGEVLVKELAANPRSDKRTTARPQAGAQRRTLGIGFGTHDTSACLFSGRELSAAVEEEKLRREKRTAAFPALSVSQCLAMDGTDISAVQAIALPASIPQYREASHALGQCNGPDELAQRGWIERVIHSLAPENILRAIGAPPDSPCSLRYYRHHTAHAASAFHLSGLPRAAVMVIDGSGEFDTITVFQAKSDAIRCVARAHYPQSLGKLYGAVCRYLGFMGPSKEGTVMGLAGHGTPQYLDAFHALAQWPDGLPVFDQSFFDFGLTPVHPSVVSPRFVELFGEPRGAEDPLTQRHTDIAASLQRFLEDCVVRLGELAQAITGENTLCYAGGVALNCVANRRLREAGLFQKVFVPPGASDTGLAVGAAYLSISEDSASDGYYSGYGLSTPFLGPSFSSGDVLQAAAIVGVTPIPTSSPSVVAARLIERDGMVGWVQGRLEFGPRALGNRSILADPRREDIRGILNDVLKERESFRPYAPAVLLEAADAIFGCVAPSPYMLDVFDVAVDWRHKIPGAVHVDGTARLQTVSAESNFLLYQLLRHFCDVSGVPVVINTSFNARDKPMVATAFDALELFSKTGLPHVIVGNYLFSKTITAADTAGFGPLEGYDGGSSQSGA